jgi:hypothetical protein
MTVKETNGLMLDRLISQLDQIAYHQDKSDPEMDPARQRQQERKPFRADCTVRFLSGGMQVAEMTARTRNISKRGIGLLVRRMFNYDEPIEVEVSLPRRVNLFMLGMVKFCRYVNQGYHEVGVLLKYHGEQSMMSNNPIGIRQMLADDNLR